MSAADTKRTSQSNYNVCRCWVIHCMSCAMRNLLYHYQSAISDTTNHASTKRHERTDGGGVEKERSVLLE